ncbi:MAG: hypothetical protein JXB14_04085 [Candidatus Altiarchaeota archaeon]|nr:hypothetical protein [Candidatus Altiarchaeota archaeon]
MAFPICDMCASTGMLCPGCEKKREQGMLTETDVIVSKFLFQAGVKGYERLVESGGNLVIIAPKEQAPRIIGYGGKTVKELSRKVGKRAIVVEKEMGLKETVETLISPNRVIAINRLYKPDGSEVLKIVPAKSVQDEKIINLVRDVIGAEVMKPDKPSN